MIGLNWPLSTHFPLHYLLAMRTALKNASKQNTIINLQYTKFCTRNTSVCSQLQTLHTGTFKRLNRRIREFKDDQYKKKSTDCSSFSFTGTVLNNKAYSGLTDRHSETVDVV
jgi:hypothetical protein